MKHLICLVAASSLLLGSDCSITSVGFTPLTDLGNQVYKGMPGGLYPGGTNRRPAAHEAAGLQQAANVRPRNRSGAVDNTNGAIVLLSIGMSNTTLEFSTFKSLASQDPQKNRRLVIVDGAQGGWSSDRLAANPGPYWAAVDQRLRAAGVTALQVQAAWLKEAHAAPRLAFPNDAQQLESEIQTIVASLRGRFPNLRLLYLSSRIYAGYATTILNPEPFAYQSGFALKWLIERQIQGAPELSFSAGRVPWMAWGPYLWADGTRPRSDGLSWSCSDFRADDGTHPSTSGQQKVARMLLDFFKIDTTSRPWFVGSPSSSHGLPAAHTLVNAAGLSPAVTPGAVAMLFGSDLAEGSESASELPLPVGLAGTMVEIGGEPAFLYSVSPTQIVFVVPPRAETGGDVVVIRDGVRSNPLRVSAQPGIGGLFSLDGSGSGPAAALHADGRLVTASDPALRGESIDLFGTGTDRLREPVSGRERLPIIDMGGVVVEATFYGPALEIPGVDRIRVIVPQEARIGVGIPVTIRMGDSASNTVTIVVSDAK